MEEFKMMEGLFTVALMLLAGVPAPENIPSNLIDAILSPFTGLLGDWFWAVFWCTVVGAVYMKSESPGPPLALLILVSVLMASVLESPVRYFFAIMAALAGGAILVWLYGGKS